MYNGVKVFSATLARERNELGDRLTDWLRANPGVEVVETKTLQSSDTAFHCLTLVVFYRAAAGAAGARAA